jgi:hypothetical protein
LVFEPQSREGRKAFFESERTIRKNSHYCFCVKHNHSPEMPEGLIALSNRPFRFGKKQNLSVLCVLSEAGGKELCASFFLDQTDFFSGQRRRS